LGWNGGIGRKNLEGGDFAPDDFAKDIGISGHFRGGLVVVMMFYGYDRGDGWTGVLLPHPRVPRLLPRQQPEKPLPILTASAYCAG